MIEGTDTAKACFLENINLFSNPQIAPEKYNLYNGLYHLTLAIERLEFLLRQVSNR